MNVLKELKKHQEKEYKAFSEKLIPNIDPKTILGVRTPFLRILAKEMVKEGSYEDFLNDLPHQYHEENMVHSFIIGKIKDYHQVITYLNAFLPYINNWAVCDSEHYPYLAKHKKELIKEILKWIKSKEPYTIRFGIGLLMGFYLDDDFDPMYLEKVSKIRFKEYYVNMMISWFFATALAKQYDATIPYFESQHLDDFCHNKSIQKAIESYRISDETKEYLRTLKIKK